MKYFCLAIRMLHGYGRFSPGLTDSPDIGPPGDLAATAREAVQSLLMDSAAAMSGCRADVPNGCMVALSSVGSEGHEQLGALVHSARAVGLERLKARLKQAA